MAAGFAPWCMTERVDMQEGGGGGGGGGSLGIGGKNTASRGMILLAVSHPWTRTRRLTQLNDARAAQIWIYASPLLDCLFRIVRNVQMSVIECFSN